MSVMMFKCLSPFKPPRVLHVWAPALEMKRKGHPDFPAMALRGSPTCDTFSLFSKIEIAGESSLEYHGDNPLSGTGGRATCLIYTHAPLLCHYDPRLNGHLSFDVKRLTPDEVCNVVLLPFRSDELC